MVALIIVSRLKSKLKTARPQHYAGNYLVRDSVRTGSMQDLFLYSTTHRTARPRDDDGPGGHGGGSVTHGGGDHGGRSGHF